MREKKPAEDAGAAQEPAPAPEPLEIAQDEAPVALEPSSEAEAERQLEQEVDVLALVRERDELKDQLLRLRAEFDNFRKRTLRDAERNRRTAAESLIRDLLPIVDNLELALQHGNDGSGGLAKGVEMVWKQFIDVLQRRGVEPIGEAGEPFSPHVHDAVMQMASDAHAENAVAQVFQRGYRLDDTVLRPARVAVSTGAPAASPVGEEQGLSA